MQSLGNLVDSMYLRDSVVRVTSPGAEASGPSKLKSFSWTITARNYAWA